MPVPHQPYCLLIGFGCGAIDQRFDGAPVWRHPKTTHSAVPKVFDAGLDRSLRQNAADIAIIDKDGAIRGEVAGTALHEAELKHEGGNVTA